MNFDNIDWLHDQYRECPSSDAEFFYYAGCSDPHEGAPFGSRPHCVKAFRLFMLTHAPQKLLEIGFNNGNSSRLLLSIGVDHVASCEIRQSDRVLRDASLVKCTWGERFRFFNGSSSAFKPENGEVFDSAYIDGDHSFEAVLEDINVCRRIGIKNILLDDALSIYGETLKSVEQSGLTVDWIHGNMMACRNLDRSNFLKF